MAKHSQKESKRLIETPSLGLQRTREETIAEWLHRYALVLRDHDGAPAQISRATIEAYSEFLRECSRTELLSEAMRLVGQRARFFARPQEIREAYQQLMEISMSGRWQACDHCQGAGFVLLRDGGAVACPKCGAPPGAGEKGGKT